MKSRTLDGRADNFLGESPDRIHLVRVLSPRPGGLSVGLFLAQALPGGRSRTALIVETKDDFMEPARTGAGDGGTAF